MYEAKDSISISDVFFESEHPGYWELDHMDYNGRERNSIFKMYALQTKQGVTIMKERKKLMKTCAIVTDAMEFVKGRKGMFKTLTMVGMPLIVQMACMVTVVAASAPMPGQIIVHPTKPNFLVYNKDDDKDGRLDPVMMCGHGGPEGFLYNHVNPGWDQDKILDYVIEHGGNCIYLMACRCPGDGCTSTDQVESQVPVKDGALIEPLMQRWEKWFDRMDKAGVIIFFLLNYDAASYRALGRGDDEQIARTKEIVKRFSKYKNLIWCIGEEWKSGAEKSAEKWVPIVREADVYGHPIANHDYHADGIDMLATQTHTQSPEGAYQKALDWHAGYDKKTTWHREMAGKRIVCNSEDHTVDVAKKDPDMLRKIMWAGAIANVHFTQLGSWEPKSKRKPPEIAECNYMRYLYTYIEGIGDYAEMKVSKEIVKSGTAWAFGRKNHYILYLVEGGDVTLDLSGSNGALPVEWYNPRTGERQSASAVTPSGSVKLSAPDGNDWVLQIGRNTEASVAVGRHGPTGDVR